MKRLHLVAAEDAVRAPEWTVATWFNERGTPRLADLEGRVAVLHAFQMLCPGCVAHGIPQAQRIHAAFDPEDVAVIGLHTVFEHHAAMQPVALAAFLHEYRVDFPVAVDTALPDSPIPATMQAFGMRGTPTLILIDQLGRLRLHCFGRADDIVVGAAVASLVAEKNHRTVRASSTGAAAVAGSASGCDEEGCRL